MTNDNSLLFCFKGTFKLFIPLKNYYFNEAIADLQVNQKIIKKEFLMYSLISLLEELKIKYTNSIMPCLNKEVIKNIKIKLPLLEMQIEISNFIHQFYSKLKIINSKLNAEILKINNLTIYLKEIILKKELQFLKDKNY